MTQQNDAKQSSHPLEWKKREVSPEKVREIASRYGIDLLASAILARRGISAPEDILYYLEEDPRYLHNPFLFAQMEDAVDRILAAKEEGEKVLVFGDRDVDGVTSVVLIIEALKGMGIDAAWRVPTANDPYGLTIRAVEQFAADYGTLIITVDCGISNLAEIEKASELGIDVIVVDHHNPQDAVPKALAIINPKMPDSGYPFRDLAGCGVVYKLIWALRFAATSLYKQQVCLLNARPLNESYLVEAVRLSEAAETGRISEVLVPGVTDIGKTRLLPFLQAQQILVYDAPLQKKILAKAFGSGFEINMYDVAPEITREIPSAKGLSLLRLKELSKLAKYREKDIGEIDVFQSLFISFVLKKANYFSEIDEENLQLVALGTIADLMPMRNENRILVRKGLSGINGRPRKGIHELLSLLGSLGKPIGARDLAWQVTPVINAAGRMGSPETAVSLFLEENADARSRIAEKVIQMNADRRKLGADSWTAIKPDAEASFREHKEKLVLVGREDIHRGITGIMASRLVNVFDVPSIAVAFLESGIAVGSMRSTRGFDVKSFLESCSDVFIDYGGHDYAAGFSLERGRYAEFAERVASLSPMIELGDSGGAESVEIDAELPKEYLNPELCELAERFEPFGEENERLVFMGRRLKILSLELIGKANPVHVKMNLDCGKYKWPAVFWQASSRVNKDFSQDDLVDVVFNVGKNVFNGAVTPQMILLDVRRSSPDGADRPGL